MSRDKQRLDSFLFNEGYFPSREKARSAIMAGLVYVNDQKVDKAGTKVYPDVKIDIRGNTLRYVSRGGLKLEKAIKTFQLDLNDKIIMDVGASTGGFTDCALQHGARLIYAVDVGYGQLAWSLRNNPQVILLERTNIRYLEREQLKECPEFVTVDVSFISIVKILPKLVELTTSYAGGVALIKPQFEAGPDKVGKKGVVRDANVHIDVIFKVLTAVSDSGWGILGLDFSPIRGPEGNIEYLAYFSKNRKTELNLEQVIPQIVEQAHNKLH
ncbi:TlyA family RNA methyltransferase [Desulfolucanica intricata]|uniref:TlyA family RNA methyltransferase n=1 Tax=Desulfolucanica intricata TaxID=1285191 RepID=UPI00082ADF0B|nr:TlyA family RNA methyltransferase [Desulfolucanica intricata]